MELAIVTNNVKNTLGVRPALPDCQKCMEGSMRQCIGQRNPVPFLRRKELNL